MSGDLVTSDEAADMLGFSSPFMRAWVADGGRDSLHAVDTPDGVRFPRAHVEDMAACLREIEALQASLLREVTGG